MWLTKEYYSLRYEDFESLSTHRTYIYRLGATQVIFDDHKQNADRQGCVSPPESTNAFTRIPAIKRNIGDNKQTLRCLAIYVSSRDTNTSSECGL